MLLKSKKMISDHRDFKGKIYSIHSGNLQKIGWEYDHVTKQGVLFVEFNRGAQYEYFPVPKELWNEFWNADSRGSWFHKNIKSVKSINFEKIENE